MHSDDCIDLIKCLRWIVSSTDDMDIDYIQEEDLENHELINEYVLKYQYKLLDSILWLFEEDHRMRDVFDFAEINGWNGE